MRLLIVIFCLVTAAADVAGAPAADDFPPAFRSASGCGGWERLATLEIRGVQFADGLTGRFTTILDARSGRLKEEMRRGLIREGDGFDGTTAWSQDYSGASHVLSAPDATALAVANAWLNRRGWCHRDDEAAAVRSLGTRTESARRFEVFQAVPRGGAPVTMWIDRSTHLLDRTVEQGNEEHVVDRFSDWRTVAGTAIAFQKRVDYPEDGSFETWSTTRVEASTPRSAASFARPKPPADFWLLRGARAATVPYAFDGWKPIIEVKLNGRGPFPFVIDTGGHFILTPATARRLGVVPVGNAHSTGSDPTVLKTRFARVREIRIGDAVIEEQVAAIIPYGFQRLERGPRPPKAGWLGLELFERFATTFDPETRTITLAPLNRPRPTPSGRRVPLLFSEDAPLARCRVAAHPGLCMLDTGNAGRTIVEGHWAERTALATRLRRGLVGGDGLWISRQNVSIGAIGNFPEIVQYAPPTKFGSEATTVEAAILSEALIDDFIATFDYGRGVVWLRLAAHPGQRPFNRSGIVAEKARNATFVVTHVLPDSPASAAKVQVGDRIMALDGRPASRFSGTDFAATNEGPVGAWRTYGIASRADGPVRTVTLRLRELLP